MRINLNYVYSQQNESLKTNYDKTKNLNHLLATPILQEGRKS